MQRYRKTLRLPNIVVFVCQCCFRGSWVFRSCGFATLSTDSTMQRYVFFLKPSNIEWLREVYKFMGWDMPYCLYIMYVAPCLFSVYNVITTSWDCFWRLQETLLVQLYWTVQFYWTLVKRTHRPCRFCENYMTQKENRHLTSQSGGRI